jgi:precorrin-4 methylase
MFDVRCRDLRRLDLLPLLHTLRLAPDATPAVYSTLLSLLDVRLTLRRAELRVCLHPQGGTLPPPSDDVLAGFAVHSATGMCIMLSTQITRQINFADEHDAEGVTLPVLGLFESDSPNQTIIFSTVSIVCHTFLRRLRVLSD